LTAAKALAAVRLALAEDPLEGVIAAPWIGPLVALGGLASRYTKKLGAGRQLIVTISVPQRDFAATLIGSGWVSNSAAPKVADPLELCRNLHADSPVRVVTDRYVVQDWFRGLDEGQNPARVRLSSSQWQVSKLRAMAVVEDGFPEPVRTSRPNPGMAGCIAGLQDSWDARLAAPAADLAIIGTLKWLREDMAAFLAREGDVIVPDDLVETLREASEKDRLTVLDRFGGRLADLLLPRDKKSATWFTRLYTSAHFSDYLPLPRDVRAVILDGAASTKHVAEVEAPIVICVLDRSVADETAAEMVVQLRNSRGEPLSLNDDLDWRPPTGIEALAFTVAL
jgi:hypothetical protein